MATLRTILALDMNGFRRGLRLATKSVQKFGRDIGAPLASAIGQLGRMTAIVGALAAAFGLFGMKAAGEIEMMRFRLANASSSADDFKANWEAAFDVFAKSPLDIGPVVNSTVLLAAFGIKGKEAIASVGSAAMAMGRPMEDIARAVGSMETESFRKLGIEIKKVGDQFTFQFRDRAGNSMKEMANGIDDARQVAIKLFGLKFGGSLERARDTLEGAISTFKGMRSFALFKLFAPLTAVVVPAMNKLSDKMFEMAQDGSFTRMGEKAVEALEKVITIVRDTAFAIHHLNENSGGNLLKWAGIFAGVGVAFKTGLAIPIMRASWLIGETFVKSILIPFKTVWLALFVFITSFNIGAALDRAFDLSGFTARFIVQLDYLRLTFANLAKNILDPEGFDAAQAELIKQFDEAMERMKPKGSGDFLEELVKQFEASLETIKNIGNGIIDQLVPDSIQSLIDEINGLPDVVLPKLEANLPDFGNAVKEGVIEGMRGPVNMFGAAAGDRRSAAQRNADAIHTKWLNKIHGINEKQVVVMQKIIDRGGIVF